MSHAHVHNGNFHFTTHGLYGNHNIHGAANMNGLLETGDTRALALALLSQQLHSDSGRSCPESSPAAHQGGVLAPLFTAANAHAVLQYLRVGNHNLVPQGILQMPPVHIQAASEPAMRPDIQPGDDLGPIVSVCGLQRREFGRRISAFNFFVKEMVPQIRLQSPGLVHQECMKKVAEKWQGMSKEDKAKWCFDPSVPKGKKRRRMSPSASSAASECEGGGMPPAKAPKSFPSLPPLSSLINYTPANIKKEPQWNPMTGATAATSNFPHQLNPGRLFEQLRI